MNNYPITEKVLLNYSVGYGTSIQEAEEMLESCKELGIRHLGDHESTYELVLRIMAAYTVKKDKL